MKIRLYQLNKKDINHGCSFLPYEKALECFSLGTKELPAEIYNLVFEGYVDTTELEDVWTIFNLNSSKYYSGHSMSVSDIVEVLDSYEKVGKFYYVEPIGFKEIEFDGLSAINTLPTIAERLKERANVEVENFLNYVQGQSAAEIYSLSYKTTFMNEIHMLLRQFIDNGEFSEDNLKELYNLDYPVEELYNAWIESDFSLETPIKNTIESFINYTLPTISKKTEKDNLLVVICEPGKVAHTEYIEPTLEAMQKVVGGYIEMYPLTNDIYIVCNEEGKINNLPLNRAVYKDGEVVEIIAGTFFIVSAPVDSEEFESLSVEQANKYKEMYKSPDSFYKENGKVIINDKIPF